MRIALLFSMFMLCVIATTAQFEKGKKVLGGSIGFNQNRINYLNGLQSDQRFTSLFTNFSLMKFTSPRFLQGFGLSYGYSGSHSGDPFSEQGNYNHSIGIYFASTRLQPLAKKLSLAFTGTFGGNYGFGKSTNATGIVFTTNSSSSYGVSLTAGMGLWYQLNDRFIITGELSNLLSARYNYGTETPHIGSSTSEVHNSSINISTGLSGFSLNSFVFGVRYLLR
jgi:hypothetical protein